MMKRDGHTARKRIVMSSEASACRANTHHSRRCSLHVDDGKVRLFFHLNILATDKERYKNDMLILTPSTRRFPHSIIAECKSMMCVIAKTVILDAPIGHILNPCKNAKSLVLCNFVYLINISKLAVDVLAQFQQQAYRTLVEDMQVEEQGEQPLGESRILCTRQADGSQHTRRCTCTQISKRSLTKTGLLADLHGPSDHLYKL